jgi:hypothetical protein
MTFLGYVLLAVGRAALIAAVGLGIGELIRRRLSGEPWPLFED